MNPGALQRGLGWLRHNVTEPRLNLVLRWLMWLLHFCLYGFPVLFLCYFLSGIFEDHTSSAPEWEHYDDMGGVYVWMLYAAIGCIAAAFWIGGAAILVLLVRAGLRRFSPPLSNQTP